MKTIEEVHNLIDRWWDEGVVGNLILYRSPGSEVAECILEEVVKAKEMEAHVKVAFDCLMDELGVERGEIRRNKSGKPDLVKLTRRYQ